MKKGLLTIGAFLTLSFSMNAQVDTLSAFFTGTPALYPLDADATPDSGFVTGTNMYGDLAKMQLFDASTGVISGGTITGAVLAVPFKVDNGGSFKVSVWADQSGSAAATTLGSSTVTLASVDTTVAGFHMIGTSGFYNVHVTFGTPIAIPAGHKFWAGIEMPTTTGDIMAVMTNSFGDAPDSLHCGEVWNDNTFHLIKTPWGLPGAIALAVYPVCHFVGAGLAETTATTASVYPNPANDVLNFNLDGTAKSIEIISMEGKLVASENVTGTTATVNVGHLTTGIYMYQVITANGIVTTNKFVKK